MQEDTILRFERKCTLKEIEACEGAASDMFVGVPESTDTMRFEDRKVCELCVPSSCIRVKCNGNACIMSHVIENKQNEFGDWLRLPCSSCHLEKKLDAVTEAFVWKG